MSDLEYGGSEELTEEQLAGVEGSMAELTKGFEKLAQSSAEARQWLNSSLGQAVRRTIAINKMIAMKGAATTKDEELAALARFDYAVWEKIENIFGTIIVEGEEAMSQLQLEETKYSPQAEVQANA